MFEVFSGFGFFGVRALHVVWHFNTRYPAGQVVELCFHRSQAGPRCFRKRAHGDCRGEGRTFSELWLCPSHGEFSIFFAVSCQSSFPMALLMVLFQASFRQLHPSHSSNPWIVSALLTTFQLRLKRLRHSGSESKLPGSYFKDCWAWHFVVAYKLQCLCGFGVVSGCHCRHDTWLAASSVWFLDAWMA